MSQPTPKWSLILRFRKGTRLSHPSPGEGRVQSLCGIQCYEHRTPRHDIAITGVQHDFKLGPQATTVNSSEHVLAVDKRLTAPIWQKCITSSYICRVLLCDVPMKRGISGCVWRTDETDAVPMWRQKLSPAGEQCWLMRCIGNKAVLLVLVHVTCIHLAELGHQQCKTISRISWHVHPKKGSHHSTVVPHVSYPPRFGDDISSWITTG